MIYRNKTVLSIGMATFLTACGGSSSGSGGDSSTEITGLPSSGNIGDGINTPAPEAVFPNQPTADKGSLSLLGAINSIAMSSQVLLNLDLLNNQILMAASLPNVIKIVDVSNPDAPSLVVENNFATSTVLAAGGYDDDHDKTKSGYKPDLVAFDDDDDDDDDDYGSSIVYPNSLIGASFDINDAQKLWAVVPYHVTTEFEQLLGITYGTQYGVYAGDQSLLSLSGENSDRFLRSTSTDAEGNVLAQTGYIQRTIQAADGRIFGWQVYNNATTGVDEVRVVELNTQAAVIIQSPLLSWNASDTLVHWAVNKDGESLALVTRNTSDEYFLHLLNIKTLASATMNTASLLAIPAVSSSGEKITALTFFNSSKSIALSIGNRVEIIDINQGILSKRSSIVFNDTVMALASHVKRGFLAVLQGNILELRAIEDPSIRVSSIDLKKKFTSMDMEENNLVVYSPTEYQLVEF